MRAADVMTRDVKTVAPETTVSEIVQTLIKHHISALPVIDGEGRLVGVVSEADLLHRPEAGTEERRPWWLDLFADPDARAEAFLKAHGRTAAEVMSRDIEVVQEDTPLDVVAKLFDERRIKRLPVIRDSRVVGIVSRSDLIRTLAEPRTETPAPKPDDLAIKDRFERTVRAAGFASVGAVTLVVEDGRVELWGVAETRKEREALELAAAEIPGVESVENHLAVREAFASSL